MIPAGPRRSSGLIVSGEDVGRVTTDPESSLPLAAGAGAGGIFLLILRVR
jgi:hypothetical protein